MTSFIIYVIIVIIITLSSMIAASVSATPCAPGCACRRKSLTSSLAMNCSGVVGFPLSHLNIVNLSSSVSDLDLSNNSITSLCESSFKGFVGLDTVTVRWNRLAVVESGAFRGTQLRRLDLAANRLAAVRPRTFIGIESTLVELDLSSNMIVSVDEAFVGLSALSRLDLRHNLLPSLTSRSLRGLYSLRHLRLDHNLIVEVDPTSVYHLSNLINLAVRDNPLSSLRRFNFPANASLSYMDLSQCALTTVPRGVPETVTYLQLRRNNITRLNGNVFAAASKLKILVLDENRISDVDDGTLRNLKNLNQLWLNNNRLEYVPAGLPLSLQRLMLDSNRIEKLSAGSFAGLSRLGTLTLMQNAISEIDVNAMQPLSELTHLDLSANEISSLPSGLFRFTSKLTTLVLSRNPLRSLDEGSFSGLTRLKSLSMSFVQTRICVEEGAFVPLSHVTDLTLDNSQWLVARFVTSSLLVGALTSLRHLSLERTHLAHLQSSVFSAFSTTVQSVRLSGSGWVCDRDLMWLRDWLMTSPLASDVDRQANRCAKPETVANRPVVSLSDHEFKAPPALSPTYTPGTRLRTGNSKIAHGDKDCRQKSRTTTTYVVNISTAAAVTPARALLTGSGSRAAATASWLRHNDVIKDVGLVQAVLIICTLVVTLALSGVIIGIIVRLACRRHRDHRVTSGTNGHVTGSRVSVRQCADDAEGWRSRASSLSRGGGGGGRTADCQRQSAGGRKPASSDVTDRLVNQVDLGVDLERSLSNVGGTRLTDEQWRQYTWEDT